MRARVTWCVRSHVQCFDIVVLSRTSIRRVYRGLYPFEWSLGLAAREALLCESKSYMPYPCMEAKERTYGTKFCALWTLAGARTVSQSCKPELSEPVLASD